MKGKLFCVNCSYFNIYYTRTANGVFQKTNCGYCNCNCSIKNCNDTCKRYNENLRYEKNEDFLKDLLIFR